MGWIKQGMQPVAFMSQEILELKIKNHAAMDDLVKGRATRDTCDTIIAALNITEALAILRIGDEYRPEISASQDAMFAMCRRGLTTNKFICSGPELNALNLAMEIHDAQLDTCTIVEMEKAIDMVQKIVQNKKARAIA